MKLFKKTNLKTTTPSKIWKIKKIYTVCDWTFDLLHDIWLMATSQTRTPTKQMKVINELFVVMVYSEQELIINRRVRLAAWSKHYVTSEIKWMTVFWRGIHDSALVCSGIKRMMDGWAVSKTSPALIRYQLITLLLSHSSLTNTKTFLFKI